MSHLHRDHHHLCRSLQLAHLTCCPCSGICSDCIFVLVPELRTLRVGAMAGASAADVRSILSLPNPSTPGPSQLKRTPSTAEKTRKPEGISRELYSLIGPSAPTLSAPLAKPRLKQKPNLGGGGRVRWWVFFAQSTYLVDTTSTSLGSGGSSKMVLEVIIWNSHIG